MAALLVVVLLGGAASCGSDGHGSEPHSTNWVLHWNEVAIDASGLDHTEVLPGEDRVFGEQFGPTRASRAMAIVHIAVFEAVNAIAGGYQSYVDLAPAAPGASMQAAIAQAAHDTLVAMFPSQAEHFDAELAEGLVAVEDGAAKEDGVALGSAAAAAILALRAQDGSAPPDPVLGVDFFTSDEPGHWRQDPVFPYPDALGGRWAEVRPFVLATADQFRIPAPPALEQLRVRRRL